MERELLEDIVHLLQNVEWLYNFPVTQIFTRNIFSQMPLEWRDALTELPLEVLNGIPQHNYQENWPSSLQSFLEECRRLTLHQLVSDCHIQPAVDTTQNVNLPQELTRGMTVKKRHEVISLLGIVKRLSDITESFHVLDIGSGIGYIDSFLHHMFKLTVIGAESEDKLVRSANARQKELLGNCSGIKHVNWTLADDKMTLQKAKEVISELVQVDPVCTCQFRNQALVTDDMSEKPVLILDSKSEINSLATRNENKEVVCTDVFHLKMSAILLGLHACADLSPIMIKMFKECSQVSSLILLSCCYHKMQLISGNMKKLIGYTNPTGSCENLGHNMSGNCEDLEGSKFIENQFKELYIQELEKTCDIAGERFMNFPMSKTLKNLLQQSNVHMTTFGLRLAAQESGLRWVRQTDDDHENHKKNVAYRALLEAFCAKEGYTLKKLRRRCVRKSHFTDLNEYIKSVTENYEFVPSKDNVCFISNSENKRLSEEPALVTQKTDDESKDDEKILQMSDSVPSVSCGIGTIAPTLSQDYIKSAIENCYEDYKYLFPLIEPLTGLQLALQPVMEALVLVDRLVYLKECGFTRVWLEKVFDVEVSPRNVALIAVR